jgi:hypothetical protein
VFKYRNIPTGRICWPPPHPVAAHYAQPTPRDERWVAHAASILHDEPLPIGRDHAAYGQRIAGGGPHCSVSIIGLQQGYLPR